MTSDNASLTFSRPLLLLCSGIIIATIISALLCQRIIVNSLNNRSAQYGQALANLAARQAIDATLNHDLVSLQVILSDVAENPDIANATIHDVENNLLVQAGSRSNNNRRLGKNQRNFTAAITLHNSIAGYVTVTMDFTSINQVQLEVYWLFGFMAVLLIALLFSALYFGRSWGDPITISRAVIPIINTPTKKTDEDIFDEDDHDEQLLPPPAFPRIELILQFNNLKALSGQLNSKSFRSIAHRIELQLKGVLALYSGQLMQMDSEQAKIAFYPRESTADATFNALCSARLMLMLNRDAAGIQLELAAVIVERKSETSVLKNLQYQLVEIEDLNELLKSAANGQLFAETELMRDEELNDRIETLDVENFEEVLEVSDFKDPYKTLLSKQLAQLQANN